MGASAAVNLSYLGNGPSGGGQIIADQTSGPKAKTLYAVGTLLSGNDATTAAVNFIDGTQSLGKQVLLQLQSVDAPVTYQGTANVAFYHSTGADSQLAVGTSVTIAGFTTSANNVTASVLFVTASSFGVSNASSAAEVNPAATATWTVGGIPAFVNVFLSPGGIDSAAAVLLIGAKPMYASAITAKGFTLNYATITTSGTAGAPITFGCVIAFSA